MYCQRDYTCLDMTKCMFEGASKLRCHPSSVLGMFSYETRLLPNPSEIEW